MDARGEPTDRARVRPLLGVGGGLVASSLGLALLGPFSARPGLGLALMLGAGGLWLVALALAWRARPPWALILGVALAMRALFVGSALELSDDVWRYVWEGGLVLEDKSPYAWAPDAPELAAERAAWAEVHGRMNNTDISAAYPPVMQAAAAGLTALGGGAGRAERARLAMALGFTLADLALLAVLAALVRRRGLPRGRLVIWAWCPLVVWEFAGSAHFDALGLALMAAGLLALSPRGTREAGAEQPSIGAQLSGAVLLGAAVHVKLLPLLALPFVLAAAWRRGARAAAILALSLAVALSLPVLWVTILEGGLSGLGAGLSAYGLRWESWNLTFDGLEALVAALPLLAPGGLAPRLAAAALLLLLLVVLLVRRVEPVAATAAMLLGYLVLTPTLHPWYLTWGLGLLPLLPGRRVLAWVWLAAASPLLYLPLVSWQTRGVWEVPPWTWAVVGLPTLALLVFGLWAGPGERRESGDPTP